jgi:hypothetical protein
MTCLAQAAMTWLAQSSDDLFGASGRLGRLRRDDFIRK